MKTAKKEALVVANNNIEIYRMQLVIMSIIRTRLDAFDAIVF